MMTYYRLFLFFLFLIPAIPAVLGHFLLPLQLGAQPGAAGLARWSLRFYAADSRAAIVFGLIVTGWTIASCRARPIRDRSGRRPRASAWPSAGS